MLYRVPPKFVRAAYGLQKALYAQNFGYSLIPIPNNILAHVNKSRNIPGPSSRVGRSRKAYRPRNRRRRRRRRKRPVKYRRPNSYGLPTYAKRYKHYVPQRRPFRYKKRNRGPTRGYRDQSDFEYYEQDISDYDDYGPGEYDYDGINFSSEYDREFINRHAELYNGGYNPGTPRAKIRENRTQYPEQSRLRPQYYHEEDDRWEEFRIPMSPKRERDKPSWTSSRNRPFSAAIAAPSRPVTLREPTNHKTFNWDPKSSSYKIVNQNTNRPQSYENHYVEEYDGGHRYVDDQSRDTRTYLDYNQRADTGQTRRNHDEDIGFGQGMEVVDDRFTGWTV